MTATLPDREHHTALFWCPHPNCGRHFTMQRGLTRHLRETHGAEHPALADDAQPPVVAPAEILSDPAVRAHLDRLPPIDGYTPDRLDRWGAGLIGVLHAIYEPFQ